MALRLPAEVWARIEARMVRMVNLQIVDIMVADVEIVGWDIIMNLM